MQINSSIITFVLHQIIEQIIKHFVFVLHHFWWSSPGYLLFDSYFPSNRLFDRLIQHLLLQVINQAVPVIFVSISNPLHFLVHTLFLLWSFQKLNGLLGDAKLVIESRFRFIELTIDVCIKRGVFKHEEVRERLLIADVMLR